MNEQTSEFSGHHALVWRAMHEGVIAVDSRGCVLDLNPAAERLTGWTRMQARGRPCEQVLRLTGFAGTADLQPHPLRECLREQRELRSVQPAILLPKVHGLRLTVRWSAVPEDGGAVLLFEDVSQNTLLTEELAFRTQHDALTGLLNRAEFEQRLQTAQADAREKQQRYCVCCMQLDQFRLVNDTAGQFASDEMLRTAAAVLRAQLRDHDLLARLDDDKFGLLMLDLDTATTRALLESLMDAVRGLRFQWDDCSYNLSMSAGAAMLDAGADNFASVLREADNACQRAKIAGHDRIRYTESAQAAPAVDRGMMGRFTGALKQNRFVLFAEDVIELQPPGRVLYREILARWRDDAGRLIMPAAFVQAAERYFLIGAMDRWVLQTALRHLAARPDDGVLHAVNLSGQSLGDEQFLDFVLTQLQQTGVAPARLCLEITETATISHLSDAVRFMRHLSDAGVRFALDDFGTGMASFSYLKNLPVHFLKIDGSFVHSIVDNAIDRSMVDAINRISHEMGLRTIAESVESAAALEQLRSIGVDMAQGRAIAAGRPLENV